MPVEAPTNLFAAFRGRERASVRPNVAAAQTVVAEGIHTRLDRRRLDHLDRTARLPIDMIVEAQIVPDSQLRHTSDSRVTVVTPPADARNRRVLQTLYGEIDLDRVPQPGSRDWFNLVSLANQGVPQAEDHFNRIRHNYTGRRRAEEGQSTVEQANRLISETEEFLRQEAEAKVVFRGVAPARSFAPPHETLSRLMQLIDQTGISTLDGSNILTNALKDAGIADRYVQILQTRVTRPVSR